MVAIDDDAGVTGNRVVPIEDERFEDPHVLNYESAILKNGLSVSAGKVQQKITSFGEKQTYRLQGTTQLPRRHVQ